MQWGEGGLWAAMAINTQGLSFLIVDKHGNAYNREEDVAAVQKSLTR